MNLERFQALTIMGSRRHNLPFFSDESEEKANHPQAA